MILCSTWALAHLAGKLRHTTGFARAQIHYVFLGAGLTAAGALTLGVVVPLVTGSSRFGVYGPYFTLLWLGFTAHSIVRHRLMDVRVVISRSAAYAAGWLLIAALLIGGEIVLDALFPEANPTLSPAGAVVLGLAASALFLGLRAAHASPGGPVPVPAGLRRAGPGPRGQPGDGHLRRPHARRDGHGGPHRPGPPPREPRHPRADPGSRRLRAARDAARPRGRHVARRGRCPGDSALVRSCRMARPRSSGTTSAPGPRAWTRAPCCRISAPGAPMWPCPSGTAG